MKKYCIIVCALISVSSHSHAMRPLIRCASSRPSIAAPAIRRYSERPKTEQQKAWEPIIDATVKKVSYFEKKQKEYENYSKMYGQLATIEIEQFKNFHQTVRKLNAAVLDPFEIPDHDAFDALENHRKVLSEKKLELLQSLPNEDENCN